MADIGDPSERGLRQTDAGPHIADRIVVGAERREVLAQSDRKAALDAHAGIGIGFPAGAELALQLVEPTAEIDQRLHRERRARSNADAGNAHAAPHIFIRVSSMSLTAESTRALAA